MWHRRTFERLEDALAWRQHCRDCGHATIGNDHVHWDGLYHVQWFVPAGCANYALDHDYAS